MPPGNEAHGSGHRDEIDACLNEGHIPKTIIEALEAVYKYGNPWGKPKNKRTEWTKGLPEDLKVKDFSQGEQAEFLFYVGCTASFDPRIQEITQGPWSSCSTDAGIDFGILGNEEQCCGNEIRRMGETGLFEELVEGNVKRFDAHKIRTSSPCALMGSMR